MLPADTPQAWLDTHLAAWFAYYEPGTEHRLVTIDDLTGGALAELHATLTDEGAPPKAAAKYLADWFGGVVARSIGFAAVATGATFVIDGDVLRWHVHPDGWAAKLELGEPRVLVPPGHEWSADAEVVEGEAERHARAVAALTDAVRPLVTTLRELSGLGFPGLWAEVGDGFGGALAYQSELPVEPRGLTTLRSLAGAESAPWKTRPSLWTADADDRTIAVLRKGGCCLAYTEPDGEKCSHCSLRDPETCEARQIEYAIEIDATHDEN